MKNEEEKTLERYCTDCNQRVIYDYYDTPLYKKGVLICRECGVEKENDVFFQEEEI